jgi:hypothetical protein
VARQELLAVEKKLGQARQDVSAMLLPGAENDKQYAVSPGLPRKWLELLAVVRTQDPRKEGEFVKEFTTAATNTSFGFRARTNLSVLDEEYKEQRRAVAYVRDILATGGGAHKRVASVPPPAPAVVSTPSPLDIFFEAAPAPTRASQPSPPPADAGATAAASPSPPTTSVLAAAAPGDGEACAECWNQTLQGVLGYVKGLREHLEKLVVNLSSAKEPPAPDKVAHVFRHCERYVRCVMEMYRMALRIDVAQSKVQFSSAREKQLRKTLTALKLQWRLLLTEDVQGEVVEPYFKGTMLAERADEWAELTVPDARVSAQPGADDCALCRLSFSASGESAKRVNFKGRVYHPQCINFWTNCVSMETPQSAVTSLHLK